MGRQTIRVRRVGSVTFGVILVVTGVIFLAQNFLPHMDCRVLLRFWPIVLIGLGVEVLLGSRQKNVDVLDGKGRSWNKIRWSVMYRRFCLPWCYYSFPCVWR